MTERSVRLGIVSFLKAVGIRVIALLVGGAVAFGMAEGAFRLFRPQRTGPLRTIYDPRLGSIPVPNLRGRVAVPGVHTYSFSHDSMGMRMTGFTDRKNAAKRILLLGDSFAYGVGVDDNQTFAYLIERNLSQGGFPVAVINAGHPGKGTAYALRLFELKGHDLKPNVTVLCFFSNDFWDNSVSNLYRVSDDGTLSVALRSATPRSRTRRLVRSAATWVFAWSHAANASRSYVARRIYRFPVYDDGFVSDANRRLTETYLRYLLEKVRGSGGSLVAFYIPAGIEVGHRRETGQVSKDEAAFAELLVRLGMPPFSLTPALANARLSLEALYFDEERRGVPNGHLTPAGNIIAADYMTGVVRAQLESVRR